MQKSLRKFIIKKLRNQNIQMLPDFVAVEEPLEICIKEPQGDIKPISVTMRTPGLDKELAIGFLVSEGIIEKLDDIQNIQWRKVGQTHHQSICVELSKSATWDEESLQRHFYLTSSCGVCGKASIQAVEFQVPFGVDSKVSISPDVLFQWLDEMKGQQVLFQKTGGTHGVGWADASQGLIEVVEDVGRHNALDKLIGSAFLSKKFPLDQGVLLLSGRCSFEMVQKSSMAGIGIICSVGAPTSLAIELAYKMNITLVGFTYNKQINLYSWDHRINKDEADYEIENQRELDSVAVNKDRNSELDL